MRTARPSTALALIICLGAVGCASSGSTTGGSSAASSVPTPVQPAQQTQPAPELSAAPTAQPPGPAIAIGRTGPFPAVKQGRALTDEPTIGKGQGAPPTTTQVKDLVTGTGAPAASLDQTVQARYVGGNYATGQAFDSSWKDNGGPSPIGLPLNQLVPGLGNGILGMKVGGRREIVIPPSQGYGDQANGPIVANETLVFVVDLVAVG